MQVTHTFSMNGDRRLLSSASAFPLSPLAQYGKEDNATAVFSIKKPVLASISEKNDSPKNRLIVPTPVMDAIQSIRHASLFSVTSIKTKFLKSWSFSDTCNSRQRKSDAHKADTNKIVTSVLFWWFFKLHQENGNPDQTTHLKSHLLPEFTI